MRAPKAVHAAGNLLLALGLVIGTSGAADMGGRYNALSHQMMCTCGCAQLLGECNHVGCPNSPGMLKTLQGNLDSGMGDHAILVAFEQIYGPTALASPMLTRFNRASWFVPPVVLILGLLGAILLLRRWKGRSTAAPVVAESALPPEQAEALRRVRQETGEA